MTITQPPRNEVETLIRHQLTMYGPSEMTLVLSGPSLEEVQAAIDAGPKAKVTVRWASEKWFKGVIAKKNKAIVRSTIKFKTQKLTDVSDLVVKPDGSFTFKGTIRHYHKAYGPRGYSTDHYKFSFDPGLNVPYTYKGVGGGSGHDPSDDELVIPHA